MSRVIIRRPPASLPPGHCDICGGDGFCELAPLSQGSPKMACPTCRHRHRRQTETPTTDPKAKK